MPRSRHGWRSIRWAAAVLLLDAWLAACAAPQSVPCVDADAAGPTVTVLDHGWHTDLGIPADELSGRLAMFRSVFPGAKFFVFSFGKRTFITAPADDWSEYILGPVPGPAAILVTALAVQPDEAYDDTPALVLPLPPGGAARLSDYIWREFAKDGAGRPRLLDRAPFDGGLFYNASGTYTLARTCNAWTAEGLKAAGLPVDPSGVVLAHQVMDRARAVAMCPLPLTARTATSARP